MFKQFQKKFLFLLVFFSILTIFQASVAAPGETIRVSQATKEADAASVLPSVSADGRYVAFESAATNLVSDDYNNSRDIFVRDTQTGITTLVSVATDGTQGNEASHTPDISADGRYVTFHSLASNLVSADYNAAGDIFVHDTQTSETIRVSLATDGNQGNNTSYSPSISADGRYIAFYSEASNLVSGDTNDALDVFVHDTQTSTTARVSEAMDGTQGNNNSKFPDISADGRYVVYESDATNLVSGDTNGASDIFVHDQQTGATTRISLATGGTQGNNSSLDPTISGDGRYVTFESYATNLANGDTNGFNDIFMHDTQTGTTTRISLAGDGSQGNSHSYNPSISGDGRYISFGSDSTNMVSGDTNGVRDIFIRDSQKGETYRVSQATDGTQGNIRSFSSSISDNGNHVTFYSLASTFVNEDTNDEWDVFINDIQTGITSRVSLTTNDIQVNDSSNDPVISADARYVVFESTASNIVNNDTNNRKDVFIYDHQIGTITRASVSTDGMQSNNNAGDPAISADGHYVVFESTASNLVSGDTNGTLDVFMHETQTGITSLISVSTDGIQGNGSSSDPAISADGRFVVFGSSATNLVSSDLNGEHDIFVRDTQNGTTSIVSLASDGTQGNAWSVSPTISADGRFIAFESDSNNFVSEDTNWERDIFVRDTLTHSTSLVSKATSGIHGNDRSHDPSISGDGRFVVFESWANNLISGDTNNGSDIFLHDIQSGVTSRVSLTNGNTEADFDSYAPQISADGRYVGFYSVATNLVLNDTNSVGDIFVRDIQNGVTIRSSLSSDGVEGNRGSYRPTISADGSNVAFVSYATNLIDGDTNETYDIFLHENDFVAPEVDSITCADTNPTTAANVNFTVVFSEDVTGLELSDFSLVSSHSNAEIVNFSGIGDTYTVTVSTGNIGGTLRLDIPLTVSVSDLSGNPLTNQIYTGDETYTVLQEVFLPIVIKGES